MPFLVDSEVQNPCKWCEKEAVFQSLRSGTSLLYVPPNFRNRIQQTCGVIRNALIPVPRRKASNRRLKLFEESLDESAVYLMIQGNEETKTAIINLVLSNNASGDGESGLQILDNSESIKHAILGIELIVEEDENTKIREYKKAEHSKPDSDERNTVSAPNTPISRIPAHQVPVIPRSISEPLKLASNFDDMKGIIKVVKSDMESLKKEIQTQKGKHDLDYSTLKNDYSTLKNDFSTLKNDYSTLKNDYSILKAEMDKLRRDFEKTNNYLNLRELSLEIELMIKCNFVDSSNSLFPGMINNRGSKKIRLIKDTPLSYFLDIVQQSDELQTVLRHWTTDIKLTKDTLAAMKREGKEVAHPSVSYSHEEALALASNSLRNENHVTMARMLIDKYFKAYDGDDDYDE